MHKISNNKNLKGDYIISLDASMKADITEKHGKRSRCVHLGAVARIQDKTTL